MESLANTKEFPAGQLVSIHADMIVWDTKDSIEFRRVFVSVWTGYHFVGIHSGSLSGEPMCTVNYHACFPATDENTFVRDGVKYVAENKTKGCLGCYFEYPSCGYFHSCIGEERKDGRNIIWKRAEPKTRPMTAKECASLPHGTMYKNVSVATNILSHTTAFNSFESEAYCLPENQTDGDPSTWEWSPLTKEVPE